MPDVYLLAALVGYFRLIHVEQMTTQLHAGAFCFMAAALLAMLSRASLDRRSVWRAVAPETKLAASKDTVSCTTCDLVQPLGASADCPRCGARLRVRKPAPLIRATALTVTAFILFFPSNILPMNVTVQMGTTVRYTIFEGVKQLFEAGLWPLGIIIFCTSIAIPAVKIVGMLWLIWSVRRRSTRHLIFRTKLHRFITEIGRWSNVDPFAITVFGPLMTFHALASSRSGWGSTAFILVVVSTLLATTTFDSRLMWDVAERPAA
jgi:paraquat-inducible protein A